MGKNGPRCRACQTYPSATERRTWQRTRTRSERNWGFCARCVRLVKSRSTLRSGGLRTMSLADMDGLVASLFIGEAAIYGPYKVPGDQDAPVCGHELLPGTLYRYDLTDASDLPVTLQIYAGISALGGEMWEQEIRVLLRAAALGHPALPEILEGDFRSSEDLQEFGVNGFAFVATRSDSPLCREATGDSDDASERQLEWVLDHLKSNHEEAIGQFSQLADALSALHGMGLVHRNIWPGTIEVSMEELESGGSVPRLRLARFEMSLLVS